MASFYQPSPRYGHSAIQVQEKSYLLGGRTQWFSNSSRSDVINFFDCYIETWKEERTTGTPPPGLFARATTLLCDELFSFGGTDGNGRYFSYLHKLQTRTLEWKEIARNNLAGGPLPKIACRIVAYREHLALIGGFCHTPTSPLQSGAEFIETPIYKGYGCTNEFHLFNVKEGT